MSPGFIVKVDAKEAIAYFRNIQVKLPKEAKRSTVDIAKSVRRRAKLNVAHRAGKRWKDSTGRLKNAIKARPTPQGAETYVEDSVEYAAAVEEGFRPHYIGGSQRLGRWWNTETLGNIVGPYKHPGYGGMHFMADAFMTAQKDMDKIISRSIDKALK